jgi:uncharacterized protein (TIGR03437 family)
MIALCPGAYGQFSNLATTDDGSLVYFVTSLRLNSEASLNLPATPTIYSVDQAGNVTRIVTPPPLYTFAPISNGNPQLSGDGTVFSYTQVTRCVGGSSCFLDYPTTYYSYLSIAGRPYGQTLGGNAQVSRSGRYVWNEGGWSSFLSSASFNTLLDLQSGATVQTPVTPANFRQNLTGNGSVLGFSSSALMLWNPTGSQAIPTVETPTSAIVNDAGTVVVYESVTHLRAVNLSTGSDILLAQSPTTLQPSISADGTLVAYVQGGQIWLSRTDGTSTQQLTGLPDGFSEAVLDGLGTAVLAVTGSRVVRVDVHTSAVQELVGRTPVCIPLGVKLVPGSFYVLSGSSLADSSQVAPIPLPTELGGVQLLANNNPLPLLSVAPTAITFQVPFELPVGQTLSLYLPNASVFGGCPAVQSTVLERQPYFAQSNGILVLAHQDFQTLVSESSPVQPGEIVHAYAIGLGAVTPPIQTGVPAPVSPLSTLSEPFDCFIGTTLGGPPINVLFAGPAPGTIGLYQVDLQMPSPLPAQEFILDCGTPNNPLERNGGLVPVPKHSQ